MLFLEYHTTTRQQTLIEKEIITFQHSPLTFSLFCEIVGLQLLYNVHKSDAIFRLINKPLQMSRGRDM